MEVSMDMLEMLNNKGKRERKASHHAHPNSKPQTLGRSQLYSIVPDCKHTQMVKEILGASCARQEASSHTLAHRVGEPLSSWEQGPSGRMPFHLAFSKVPGTFG